MGMNQKRVKGWKSGEDMPSGKEILGWEGMAQSTGDKTGIEDRTGIWYNKDKHHVHCNRKQEREKSLEMQLEF